jgi:GT2 family glycosyltransferase
VAVCSRDRPDRLAACLDRLTSSPDADELLVVDSASLTSATSEVARAAGVRCVRADEPGLARARNLAVGATATEAVAFTDDDCRPQPGWAAALRAGFDLDRAAAESEPADRVGFVLGRVLAKGEGEPLSVALGDARHTIGRDCDPSHLGHGANLAIRRECWEAVDGFDELLGVGARFRSGEDTDYLWRALRAGWIGRFEPDAVVAHDQWRGRRQALSVSYGYGVGAGAVRTKVRRLAGRDAARAFAAGSVRATLRQAGHDLGSGYEFGAATSVVRAAGIAAGRARAGRLGLVHGRFGPP